MASRFVAFLRGISNVPMQPFRGALVDAGLQDVRSYGGTGNLLFSSGGTDRSTLERRVSEAVGVQAFVRSRAEMADILASDPFSGRPGAALFFTHADIDPTAAARISAGGFEGDAPVIMGAQVYFVHPMRRPGRKTVVDLERELAVRGTIRGSRVVQRVFELM